MRAFGQMLFCLLIGVVVLCAARAPAQSTNVPSFVPGSWTLVVMPDTQNLSAQQFREQTSWIVTNKDSRNIKYVLQLGDLTDGNNTNQWISAKSAFSLLDGVVPYAIVCGNHDYGAAGNTADRSTYLNDYFSVTNFEACSTFGGLMDSNRMDNSYHLFNAGGADWLIMALEFGPRNGTVAWANQVASNYPTRRKILITHAYLYSDSTRYDWATKGSSQGWSPYAYGTASDPDGTNDGEQLWKKLVNVQPNFAMTINGHVLNSGLGFLSSTNQFGDVVHQMLVNYQDINRTYLRILEFRPDGKTVQVKCYSPHYGTYVTASENQFQFILDPPVPLVPTVSNDGGASDVTDVSATLNGNLAATGTAATVISVCWGATDSGTNTVGWDNVVNFGQRAAGALSTNLTGLTPGATYYYRFYASNSAGVVWSDPAALFTTASPPSINISSGATSITPLSAQLNGDLTAGGNASVTVYWGINDGGTTASNWQYTNSLGMLSVGAFSCNINGLNPSTAYSYRCYATNAAGSAWADSTASFLSAPTLANGSACGMKIKFAGYNKAETLTNFPALVVFGTNIPNFAYNQFQSPNGWDLSFAASNQVTQLNHEIGQWNTNGSSYVWVQIPKLSSSNDYIWAYWGNPAAAGQAQACTTNGSTWDANCFMGVWHLGEKLTQNQSSGINYDSTSYANNGLQHNNGWTNGIVGGAQNFDGSSCYINTTASMTNGAMTNTMTLSLWVKVLGPADWSSTMTMLNQNNGSIKYYFSNQMKQKQSLNLGTGDRTGNGSVSTGVWTYLTETFAQAGGNSSISYMNGAYDGTYARADRPGAADTWYFGKSGSGSAYYYQGAMEEIRIEQVRRSSNWVWACYQTMASNTLFSSYQIQTGSTSTAATVHGIPYSWLASYGITNMNDSVETQHIAGSSFDVLQDYIAGLNPMNPNNCFLVDITNAAGQILVSVPSIAATGTSYTGKGRYYDLELRTNLTAGSWQPVTGYTNILGNDSVIIYTNGTQEQAKFYRVKARLQP
jgi:hypothetical protein